MESRHGRWTWPHPNGEARALDVRPRKDDCQRAENQGAKRRITCSGPAVQGFGVPGSAPGSRIVRGPQRRPGVHDYCQKSNSASDNFHYLRRIGRRYQTWLPSAMTGLENIAYVTVIDT